jgi:hypothetical protein
MNVNGEPTTALVFYDGAGLLGEAAECFVERLHLGAMGVFRRLAGRAVAVGGGGVAGNGAHFDLSVVF